MTYAASVLLALMPSPGAPKVEIETSITEDLTGDGVADHVSIRKEADHRILKVVMGSRGRGWEEIGSLVMDADALGPAELSVARGILLVKDLTGGTTALSSTYRWRYEPSVRKMRLIGDDVSLYSRTYAHDGRDISTNRLTGVQISTFQKLKGRGENASYVPSKPVRKAVSRDPIYMGDEPNPARTMGWGN